MAIKFKELKQYISRTSRISVCFQDGHYDNYTLISDIPEGKYENLFVYGIGKIDVEFPLDVYTKPDVKQQARIADTFLGSGLEIVLSDEPRADIDRNNKEKLMFGDLKSYLQTGGGFSVILREDWSSEEYEWRQDIPQKYNELFVYGIGIEENSKKRECLKFKTLDTALTKQMVIVLSKTPR